MQHLKKERRFPDYVHKNLLRKEKYLSDEEVHFLETKVLIYYNHSPDLFSEWFKNS